MGMKNYLRKAAALKDPRFDLFSLVLFATNKCDGKCKGCFYAPKLNKIKYKDLTAAEIDLIAEEIGKVWHLQVSGGEPFLRPDLHELIHSFTKRGTKHVSIPTNGLNPGRTVRMVKHIRQHYAGPLTIAVSIDGLDKNERLRGTKIEGPLSTIRKIKRLKKKDRNLSLTMLTRMTDQNITEIPKLHAAIKQEFPHMSFKTPLIRSTSELNPPSAREFTHSIHKHTRFMRNFMVNQMQGSTWKIPCIAGKKIAVLDSDGDLRFCELLPPVGNVREGGFWNVWNNEKASEQQQQIENLSCSKGCTHGTFATPSMLDAPFKTAINYLK